MARFREMFPNWETLPTQDLVRQAGSSVICALAYRIADWYRANLPLWAVLQHFGYTGEGDDRRYPRIGPEVREQQMSCMLPSHGTVDRAPSSRYYLEDDNDHTLYGHIYCFKCNKAYTSFWYLYSQLKFHQDARYVDVYLYIERTFGLPFPRHILLDADPDRLEDEGARDAVTAERRQRFVQARLLRERYRDSDRPMFLALMAELYTTPLQCTEVAVG